MGRYRFVVVAAVLALTGGVVAPSTATIATRVAADPIVDVDRTMTD